MRGAIGRRLPNPNGYNVTSIATQAPFLIQSSTPFSSSSGTGRGRGRGGAGGFDGGFAAGRGRFDFTRPPSDPSGSDDPGRDSPESRPPGFGHGRGRVFPSDPIFPAVSSFVSSIRPASQGVGRGRDAVGPDPTPPGAAESHPMPPPSQEGEQPPPPPKKPIFVKLQEMKEATSSPEFESGKVKVPSEIINVRGSGTGRGKPIKELIPPPELQEENRHLRRYQARQQSQSQSQTHRDESQDSHRAKLSKEEAVKKAVGILSHGGEAEASGGRGRGRGIGRGGGRGRGREGWRHDKREEMSEAEELKIFLGDNADGEKFANKVGPEIMTKLTEGFEEMCDSSVPSTADEAFVDALDTNLMIECEPEYLMADFESNPDIDEKPPIPLRDALEKMKPFLMCYEGIQSQEEWEEAVNEAMERVPLLKEIVDHYSGPDRVTAKKQNEELERVAKTIPKSAPDSVKRFADRAVLTLQSNPGWGFDKKCQFMDKLVLEVTQHYK